MGVIPFVRFWPKKKEIGILAGDILTQEGVKLAFQTCKVLSKAVVAMLQHHEVIMLLLHCCVKAQSKNSKPDAYSFNIAGDIDNRRL
jgi:uncharacterized protein YwlG (UPF0340 family)